MWHAVCGMRRVACESAVAIGTRKVAYSVCFFFWLIGAFLNVEKEKLHEICECVEIPT